MSSESSVSTSASSRIRQFGLYRTIDARTEEFLQQSRKRQIKQGCLCATISTVITVTVVIAICLIYMEYGLNRGSNNKSNWIDLFNESLALPFEERLSKSKLHFDKTTIKLLPLLIKALKQNKYLQNKTDNNLNLSSEFERKKTKPIVFKRNLFPDSKNIIKKPIYRHYTIEYKPTPLVYYKIPSTNLAYFTKVRKIRDYKRVMEYVDKMISNKLTDHTQPMFIDNYSAETEEPTKQNIKPIKIDSTNFTENYTNSMKTELKSDKKGCKCQNIQLDALLNKIISTIQQFLPDGRSNTEQNNNSRVLSEKGSLHLIKPKDTTINNKTSLPLHLSEFSNIFQQQESALENNIQKINPISRSKLVFSYNFDSTTELNKNLAVTTNTQYIEPTDSIETFVSTQPMMSAIKPVEMKNFGPSNVSGKYLLHRQNRLQLNNNSVSIFNSDRKLQVKPPITTHKSTIAEEISKLSIPGLELFKSKVFPSNIRFNITKNYTKPLSIANNSLYYNYLNKIANKSYAGYDIPRENKTVISSTPDSQEDYVFEFPDLSNINNQEQYKASDDKTDLKSIINRIQSKLNAEKKEIRGNHNSATAKLEGSEVDKAIHEDYYPEEYDVKPTDSMISLSLLSSSNKYLVGKDLTKKAYKEDTWNFLSTDYDRVKLYSMLPMNRPNYLEIRRHGWRADENEDYDLNMKHNNFDSL